MPLHLGQQARRRFLQKASAAAAVIAGGVEVSATLDKEGCHLTVHAIDRQHQKNREQYSIAWRTV